MLFSVLSVFVLSAFYVPNFVSAQLHFATVGGWGSGGHMSSRLSHRLKTAAEKDLVSFLLAPGPNFDQATIRASSDKKWDTALFHPLKGTELNIPFYTVLGAVDWNSNHTAFIDRSNQPVFSAGPHFTLPNWWYHHTLHFQDASQSGAALGTTDVSVAFVFVDTYILDPTFPLQNVTELHWQETRGALAEMRKAFDWVFVVGDAPLLTSGALKHNHELISSLGKLLEEFSVDAYISGQDPSLEILEKDGLTLINCGSSTTVDNIWRFRLSESVARFNRIGFCTHTLLADTMITNLVDGHSGKILAQHTQTRRPKPIQRLDRFRAFKKIPPIHYVEIPKIRHRGIMPEDPFIIVCGTFGLIVVVILLLVRLATFARQMHRKIYNIPCREPIATNLDKKRPESQRNNSPKISISSASDETRKLSEATDEYVALENEPVAEESRK